MERNIGDPGEILNNSVATRAVNIEPDMRKVRRLDIYHRSYRKLLQGWGLTGVALLAAGVGLWYFQHQIWGGIVIALSLPVLFIAARLPQTLKGDAYRSGLLIPGIITSLSPLTLLCLTDARTSSFDDDEEEEDETAETTAAGPVFWGVKQVVIEHLTMQPERLGEQVPCVSLFGETNEGGDFYLNFEPRPLAWGTDDARLIEQARQAIDNEEWLLLPVVAAAYAASEKNENEIAYFDAALRPVRLPKPATEAEAAAQ
ncbi:DUF3239 domain-containing protein [Hymenobacter sp. IS2118]|uniref:DUF3239 domain-containing protein n=1 Tax=Hymenobacter sp. IS2118 TaxID=1505605 RepID=UPI0005567B7E|nr:DUF3239 domain-containing protein [Hymenobacter sp. IS2118]